MSLDLGPVLFFLGVILLVTIMILAVTIPNPTPSQRATFHIVLALAAALIATAIPGFLQIESEFVGFALRAGGAIAVFIFVYRLHPAASSPQKGRSRQSVSRHNGENNGGGSDILVFLLLIVLAVCGWAVLWRTDLKFEDALVPLADILPDSLSDVSTSSNRPIEINKTGYSSNVDGFAVTLTRVEFLENDRMRWNFQFWNQSNKDQNFSINYAETYLADGSGNRYRVIGTDTAVNPNEAYEEKIQAGVRVNHWLEFPGPIGEAKSFNVVLSDAHLIPHFGGVEFPTPIFTVNLDE